MSEHESANNHDGTTVEIDREFERELADLFHRTTPLVPDYKLDSSVRRVVHKSSWGRTPILVRIAVPLAAVVLFVTFGVIWQPSEADANVAFADVQESVRKTETLTYRQTTMTAGVEEKEIDKFSVMAPSTVRFDMSNGTYSLLDLRNARSMYFDPGKKQAMLFEGMGQITEEMQMTNLYDFFLKMESKAASELPVKMLNGKNCPGFLVEHQVNHPFSDEPLTIELSVWVDPQSKLPVRIEEQRDYKEEGKAVSQQVVMDQFVFNASLDPELFSFDPPEGYTLQSYGTAKLPDPVDDKSIQEPVLTPNVGLGPVTFGMLADEVKKHLGEPDRENPIGKNGVSLDYNSRGYGIQVSDVLGVWLINATSPKLSVVRIREFAGKTDKGIGLGASEADVRKAYGEPSRVDDEQARGGLKTLYYDDLNGWFSFAGGKLNTMTFNIPRETKLKMFELRKPENDD